MSGTPSPQYTRPLNQLRRADEPLFGGKSAGLGELLAADVPVPPGFAIAATALADALSETGEASAAAIAAATVPDAVREQVRAGYDELARTVQAPEPPVAVRSSAVGEDSHEATFAGQQDTYLWVRGAGAVVDAVRGLLGEPVRRAGNRVSRQARRHRGARDGRRRAADGRRRDFGSDVHLQPGHRRPEHGRDQRQLGARRGGRRRRRDAR